MQALAFISGNESGRHLVAHEGRLERIIVLKDMPPYFVVETEPE